MRTSATILSVMDGVEFEKFTGAQPSINGRLLHFWTSFGWKAIAIPIALLTLTALVFAYQFLLAAGLPVWQALLLGFLAALPATEGATGLFNVMVHAVEGSRTADWLRVCRRCSRRGKNPGRHAVHDQFARCDR